MNGIYLITGGNMGNRVDLLGECATQIEQQIGKVTRKSGLYETAAWGNTDQPAFLNQVLFLKTTLNPKQVLHQSLSIEQEMGRIRNQKWEARIIDIDILFFNQDIIQENHLTIPHPHIAHRRFVLVPLCEIAPKFVHPVSKHTVESLLEQCEDPLEVKLFNKSIF